MVRSGTGGGTEPPERKELRLEEISTDTTKTTTTATNTATLVNRRLRAIQNDRRIERFISADGSDSSFLVGIVMLHPKEEDVPSYHVS
jgi:hypothetical protein